MTKTPLQRFGALMQRLGKSLMLPVSVLPAAAILLGVGYAIDPTGWGGNNVLAHFLVQAGDSILGAIPILFAVGVAFGMSKDQNGAAALSGLVAFLVITTLLSPGSAEGLRGELSAEHAAAFGNISNAFIGLLSGAVAAFAYNRFHKVELPAALAFFSGRRAVPITTAFFMLIVSGVLLFVWPIVYAGLLTFGEWMVGLGPFGAALYGFFNRLLIPLGLHHALNSIFWFDFIGINDLGNFWGAGDGVIGTTGMYMAGFFPVMMFGLPGACLAMYVTAKSKAKKTVFGLMLAAAFAAFLTGVTEPVEFSFMFVAPVLYLVHAVLTAVSMFIAASMQWFAGFAFSAGLIDYVLSIPIEFAIGQWWLLALGVVYFFVYFGIFYLLITKLNLKTPGREDDDDLEAEQTASLANNDYTAVAAQILEGLGGAGNVTSLDYCATRLRVEVKDYLGVNEKAIKAAGVSGVIRPSKTSVQVIVGTKVQFVADELQKLLG
ncbi:MAG: N-acetylglucosamine-specific PTS transporter subunit IIBC [Oscillospiraceae bacterium]|nr:N-acetylglucosamine-specific PTS transporter subunit IIBC [Oscillospiraceae bacterium]